MKPSLSPVVVKSQNYIDVPLPQINKGMIQEEVMSYHSSPEDALSWLENADNDSAGIITSRREFKRNSGFSGRVSSPSKVVQVNNLVNNDKAQVYWQEGRHLQQQQLITTSSLTTYSNFFSSASYKNRYDILQGYLIITNAGATDPIYIASGNTTTPTNIDTKFTNIPIDLVSAGFNGRIWGSGTTLSVPRLYYSDVIPVAGVSALPATPTVAMQYLGLNLGTESPTALIQTAQTLFVFSMNKILRVFGINSLDNFSISNVGTVSQESIMRTPNGIFFYHPSGIYAMSETGQTKCISDPIYYIFKRVPPANQKNVLCWHRDQFLYFYLGTLTGYNQSKYYYVRYNTVTGVWSIGSSKVAILCATSGYLTTFGSTETATSVEWYPDAIVMSASDLATHDVFNPSLDNQTVYGDFGSSSSISENIDIDVQTKWYSFETLIGEQRLKRIAGLAVPHINAQGINVAVQLDNDDPEEWRSVGALDSSAVTLFRDYQSDSFNRIKFRFFGTSKGARVKISMPTLLQLDDLGYEHQ